MSDYQKTRLISVDEAAIKVAEISAAKDTVDRWFNFLLAPFALLFIALTKGLTTTGKCVCHINSFTNLFYPIFGDTESQVTVSTSIY